MPESLLAGSSAIVTGGAGFIGSHLVDGLLAAGVEQLRVVDDLSLGRRENLQAAIAAGVCFEQLDCCEIDALRDALAGDAFDYCFNLAVIPLPASLVDPRANVDRNVAMTTAVCELGREGRFRRLIQYSSSEVYGTARTAPMAEDHPLVPHTPYAAAKAATDLVAMSYATTFGLEVVTVRPFNTYGERQNDRAYAGIIPAVIRNVRAGKPVQIYGDGEQTRDMTYVGDTVAGTIEAAVRDSALSKTINLGSGQEASVNEMVRLLLDAIGHQDHPVEHVEERPGDVRRLLADITLARTELDYEPSVSLRDGLLRTVAWYAEQHASF
ncbi:MAG: dTDP-glucose 4,6-dehydratase [Solirubrobacterales bacterium]